MTDPIKIKAGATVSLPMLVLLPAGTWTGSCQIRKGDDTLVGELAVTLTPLTVPDESGNTHAGLLEATSVQTAAWPVGTWRADVRFADNSIPPEVIFTDPFAVQVDKAATHG